jgi:hypothetical protein
MKPLFLIISEMVQLRVEQNCWFTSFISLPSTTSGRHFRFGPYRIGFRSKTKTRAIANDWTRRQVIWEPKHRRSVAFQMSARDTLRRAGLGRLTIIRHYYVAAALLAVRLPKCPSGSGYEQPRQCIMKARPASGGTKLDVAPPPGGPPR